MSKAKWVVSPIGCPMEEIKRVGEELGHEFPMSPEVFNETVKHLPDGSDLNFVFDGRLRFQRVRIPTQRLVPGPWAKLDEVYLYYDAVVKDIKATWPRSVNCVCQYSRRWAGREMTDAMVENTLSGMLCSLLFAFIVLLIVTKNYIVASLSILTISSIMGTMMAVIYFRGDGIGISEGLSIIVFVGFSVDYVVHMSHQYLDSVYELREQRVNYAFQ